MGLKGKLVAAIEFKAGGDLFHELFRHKPHDVSNITPEKIQACDLHEGNFGHVGSVISWKYTHEGKEKVSKQLIQLIDEEKKLIEFKILEGDLMEEYKDFIATCHVGTKNDVELVTWTLDYERLHGDVGHPISLLSFIIDMVEDIEAHHLGKA